MKTTFTFRQLISATLLLVAVAFGQNAMAQWYGAGTQDNPYQIRSIADLNALATNVNSGTTYNGTYFVLTTNLTYTYTYAWNSTNGSASENNFVAIGGYGHSFQGHFDGGGHTISGIRIYKDGTTTSDQLQGVFGYLSYGTVRNITVADASITGYQQVGAIAGCNSTGTIEDCVVASNVGIYHFKDNSSKHGGVVGANTNGNVRRCTSSATIRTNPKFANTVSAICGGIIGYQSQGQAVPHYVEDNIALNVVVQSGQSVGGAIIGKRDSGNINYLHLTNNYYSNCTINGTVNATNVGVGNPAGDMNGARSVHTLTLGTNITAIGESVVIGNTTYYASNTTVTLEYNKLPAGYLISFSYNDGTIHNIDGNTFQMPAANATVSATITPITYNITYDLDGGSVASANPTSYNVETTTFTLNNPTRTGYTFAGWTGTDLTEATQTVTIAQGSMGNRSYTANWTLITYNITYDLDGGSVATANPATYNVTTNTFTLNKPTKTGYTFAGWTGTDLTEATQTVTITQGSIGDRSYTANWAVIPWTGDGFSGSPYLIIYPSQLDLLAKMVNGTDGYTANTFQGKHFKLGNDITYSTTGLGENESNYTAIGNGSSKYFQGTFDGDGKTISGIRIYTTDDYQGLFGYVYNGTVKNVVLANSIIAGGDQVGGIVGNNNGIVTNCIVESSVTINAGTSVAFYHGGIVGSNSDTVSGCISAATVSNNGYSNCKNYGGIVGNNGNAGTVKDCLYSGTSVTASSYYGSIVGQNNSGTLTNNYYTAIELGGVGGNGNATISTDTDGARRARTITLGENVVLVGDETEAYNLSGLTAIGTGNYALRHGSTIYCGATQNITLNYTGTPPEGYRLAYYTVNNEPFEGNTFEMPAADVVVEAVLLECYYTYNSTTGELALIWGEFNKDNKWGSDVTPSAVTSVTATDEVSFTGDCTGLFQEFTNCTSIDLSNVNTDALTQTTFMFYDCRSLTTLDLSSWNVGKVTDMNRMFESCSNLQSLNLSGWNTESVIDIHKMFKNCSGLTTIEGLSDFNTGEVTNMSSMFFGCESLQSPDLSGWNTGSVTNMNNMFYSCQSIETLDLSGWDTGNVTDMTEMFQECFKLTTIYVGEGWSTESVTDYLFMFEGCVLLHGGIGTTYNPQQTHGDYACYDKGQDQPGYLTGVFTLTLPEDVTTTTAATLTHNGVNYYKGGHDVTLNYNGTPPENMRFYHFTVGGEPIDGDTFAMPFYTAEVGVEYQARYTFDSETGVLSLNFGEFNKDDKWGDDVPIANVTSVTATDEVSFTNNCYQLFKGFSSCTSMDLSDVNTDGITIMNSMFSGCSNLTTLNLSGWNTSNVTYMNDLFNGCTSLTTIEGVSGWNVSNVTSMDQMFFNCSNLTSPDLSGWNTASVTSMRLMFRGCVNITSLDLSGWNTEAVTDMGFMFRNCSSLVSL
ncbi:MAG: BspA family leucine-rich repeat surface protein, partial [Muribaculaceae bacterium]|nr:BspA family leucine-rich repeat surface protein [Muribaculaceae bacterium]